MVVSSLPETGEVRRVMGEFKRVFLVVGHKSKKHKQQLLDTIRQTR